MNGVPVQVDNVHLALPVLLHVMGEHGIKDGGSRGEDVLVATELPALAGHNAVRKLALSKSKLNRPNNNKNIVVFSQIQKCWRCRGRAGRQVL